MGVRSRRPCRSRICTPLTLQHHFDNYFMFSRRGPKSGLDRYFSNKGKTAYVYPAFDVEPFFDGSGLNENRASVANRSFGLQHPRERQRSQRPV